jgi:hypothetical protein
MATAVVGRSHPAVALKVYCLSGLVFLGSLDHDGQEVFDAVRCRMRR